MRASSMLLSALVSLALGSLVLAGCDDTETPLDPDVSMAADDGRATGRDMRSEAGPDMAPEPIPDIDISPGQLALVADPGEASRPGMLTVRNVGDAPLTITGILLNGAADFVLDPSPPGGVVAVLAPGEATMIGVVFAPEAPGDREASLLVRSDDPDEPEREIRLTGRNPESCVRAMPSSVNLGSVAVGGQSARFRVQIQNCGDRPANIGEIALAGADGFSWEVAQGDGSGQVLGQGGVLILAVWYDNLVLGAEDTATTVLTVPTDLPMGDLRINVAVRGGGGPTCNLVIEPDAVDYENLRLGATRPVELAVINRGTADCELRDLTVVSTDGPEENGFVVVRGLEGEILAGGAEQTIEVAYAPVVADPVGDRGELRLSFHDPHRVQNRTATAMLRGVGSEALIGADPAAVETGLTTDGCVSWARSVTVSNVGFVPICVTGFRYEGDDCPRFVPTSEPSVPQGECVALERGDGLDFTFRHQPAGVGDERCTLIVESDAQNTQAIEVPLHGTGTDTAATVDEAVVGDLNPLRAAYFSLSRPCDRDTLRLFVNDEETDRFDFSAQRNALVFEARRHPADEDDAIRMAYDALCFQLEE